MSTLPRSSHWAAGAANRSMSRLSGNKVKADLTTAKRRRLSSISEFTRAAVALRRRRVPRSTGARRRSLATPVTSTAACRSPPKWTNTNFAVNPGEEFIFSLQARELGTSKIMGLITVYDEKGKRLASAGDGPLPVDVGAVQVSSRTQGDPT